MSILHIIKRPNDRFAYEMVLNQQECQGRAVAVLLLHDAVYTPPQGNMEVWACRDDVEARGIESAAKLIGYDEIVKLLLKAESTVCW
ncbi:MAG: DsrH/TusB family sulfur metabolism protein [bacterium]|nr:DsrH/TusB family sulfur metabolism protein [bacterium]